MSRLLNCRLGLLLSLTLGALLLFSQGAFSTPAEKPGSSFPNSDRGLYVFQAYCVGCHGESGRGDGPMAGKLFRDFGIRPADLAAASFQDSHDDQKLAEAIRGGGRAVHKTDYMPAWGGTLTERQVDDLVAFVRELELGPVEVSATIVSVGDDLELGRTLYTVRCLACHGPGGKGDGPLLEGLTLGGSTLVKLPDFSDYQFSRGRSDKDLEEVLYLGVSHSGLVPETEPGWWDRVLEKDEMRALIFYVRALSLQRAEIRG